MKKICSYHNSRKKLPVVHCNRKFLIKEKYWLFQAKVYLPPKRPNSPARRVIEIDFNTPEPVYYREVMMLCIEVLDELLHQYPNYRDYEWNLSTLSADELP